MTGSWVPEAWGEAVPVSGIRRYALIEMAALPPATRNALFGSFDGDSQYWPLIDDDRQLHLKREGPWLLLVNDQRLREWQNLEPLSCALHAWIESGLEGEQLASQLAPAMVIENQEGKRSLLRFYIPELIERLHAEAPEECRDSLFGGIQRWWYRGPNEWMPLAGVYNHKHLSTWKLKVSNDLWAALHGDMEVMNLTAELIESAPDLFHDVCSCERPRLVSKALKNAEEQGLTRVSDRRTFAYLQLSQGEDTWASKNMQALLKQASHSETPLIDLLEEAYGERN
ncbi:DUF4123 domain-containing protein [Litchfieldella xinjiangensis]|uniref:DUF4123 domain-containing protein n=1 Tax=Litchfieldella xinjiangensis TaxID=1166948 RepID=UPI0005BDAB6C|nr:DUF4123 domain-containing protein [Halomonas xinjiangensis]